MSAQDVNLVRRAYEAWNRGDLDSAFEFLDSDVVISTPPDFPGAGRYHGLAEAKRWAEDFVQMWAEIRAEPEEFIDAGNKVVVFVRYFGRGKESGAEVRGVIVDSHVLTLRDGRVVKLEMFQGTAEALSAVGIQ